MISITMVRKTKYQPLHFLQASPAFCGYPCTLLRYLKVIEAGTIHQVIKPQLAPVCFVNKFFYFLLFNFRQG